MTIKMLYVSLKLNLTHQYAFSAMVIPRMPRYGVSVPPFPCPISAELMFNYPWRSLLLVGSKDFLLYNIFAYAIILLNDYAFKLETKLIYKNKSDACHLPSWQMTRHVTGDYSYHFSLNCKSPDSIQFWQFYLFLNFHFSQPDHSSPGISGRNSSLLSA